MKHAGPAALDRLELLLVQIRTLPGLVEKSRGVFYRKGKAFLHFHEDPAGLFADVRFGGRSLTGCGWRRRQSGERCSCALRPSRRDPEGSLLRMTHSVERKPPSSW